MAQRHQQRRSAPAFRQKSERWRLLYFRKFSIRGMPEFYDSERMLSFGSPGDPGISAAVRRRTLPLGKFYHPPTLAVPGIALPLPGHGRGPRGHSRGLENSASPEAPRHFPWHGAINNDAALPRSDRKVSAGAFGISSGNLVSAGCLNFMYVCMCMYIYIYIYIYIFPVVVTWILHPSVAKASAFETPPNF